MRHNRLVLWLGLSVGWGSAAVGQDGILGTVAGTGAQGSSGDGGLATAAAFNLPMAVITRPSDGSQFVADAADHIVRRIDASGVITTFCGQNGQAGYSGDGGPASQAVISAPYDLALDSAGNLFIAEAGNNIVRKIAAATGTITTFAGTGVAGFNNLSGPAREIELNLPAGLAVDANDNLYVADLSNGLVRRIDRDGILTTVAGDFESKGASTGDGGPASAAGLNGPGGLAVGRDGSIFIAEIYGHRVRKVAPDGTITTYVGTGTAGYSGDGGSASAAQLQFDVEERYPSKLACSADGSLMIADTFNHRIRRVDPSCCIETIAGNGTSGYSGDGRWGFDGQLNRCYGVAAKASGDLVIADTRNFRLRELDSNFTAPAGANATVSIGSETTLTFQQLDVSGTVTVDVRGANDPPVPGDLQLNSSYVDINTTASFTGLVSVTLTYSDPDPTDPPPEVRTYDLKQKVLHYSGAAWEDATKDIRPTPNEIDAEVSSLSPFAIVQVPPELELFNFRRGDGNLDREVDISDAVFILLHLFVGAKAQCREAMDANDDSALDISDALTILHFLFLHGPALPTPGAHAVGVDGTPDALGCEFYPR